MPDADVEGVGAVVEPPPPLRVEYHFKEVPTALSVDALAPTQ